MRTFGATASIVDYIAITTDAQIGMFNPQDNGIKMGAYGTDRYECWIDYTRRIFPQ